jgi:hypothetical protein
VFAFTTERMRDAGTYLYGRRMYEAMAEWETNPTLAQRSERTAEFATGCTSASGPQIGRSPVAVFVEPWSRYAPMVRCAIRIWCTSSAPSAKRAQRACWYMCASGVSVE